jgi:hypothetical protein
LGDLHSFLVYVPDREGECAGFYPYPRNDTNADTPIFRVRNLLSIPPVPIGVFGGDTTENPKRLLLCRLWMINRYRCVYDDFIEIDVVHFVLVCSRMLWRHCILVACDKAEW